MKTCNKCDQERELSLFRANPNRSGGYEHTCMVCTGECVECGQPKPEPAPEPVLEEEVLEVFEEVLDDEEV